MLAGEGNTLLSWTELFQYRHRDLHRQRAWHIMNRDSIRPQVGRQVTTIGPSISLNDCFGWFRSSARNISDHKMWCGTGDQ
jgi:hypothetical protein